MERTLIFLPNRKLDGGNFHIVPEPKLMTVGNKSRKKDLLMLTSCLITLFFIALTVLKFLIIDDND